MLSHSKVLWHLYCTYSACSSFKLQQYNFPPVSISVLQVSESKHLSSIKFSVYYILVSLTSITHPCPLEHLNLHLPLQMLLVWNSSKYSPPLSMEGSTPTSNGVSMGKVAVDQSVREKMRTLSEHNERTYTAPRCRACLIKSVVVNQFPQLKPSQHGKMHPIVLENGQCQCCYYWLHLGIHFMRSHVTCGGKLRQFLNPSVVCGGVEK